MSGRRRIRGAHGLAALTVALLVVALTVALPDAGRPRPHGTPTVADRGITALKPAPKPRLPRLDRLVAQGQAVYCGGSGKRLVALTFDDGPGPYTRGILDVLRRHHAR